MYENLRRGFCRAALVLGLAGRVAAQITEVPDTVQPGHFLLEMDVLSLTIDRDGAEKYLALGAASTFLSTGLAHNWDLQVGAQFFITQKYEDGSFTEHHSGIGDVYVRTKWRFYDEDGTAVAIMPYVKIPTNSGGVGNHSVEGGMIVPWSTKLPVGLEFSAMAELDLLRSDADDGYDTFWYAAATVHQSLTKALGLYAEATLGKSSGHGGVEGLLGIGATVYVSQNTWLDFAMYKGVSTGAADWNHVIRFNIGF